MATAARSMMDILNDAKKQAAARSGRRERTAKATPGKSRWRILPSWRAKSEDGSEQPFFHSFGLHFIKAPGSDQVKAAYVCTEATYGRECPVCDAISAGIQNGTDDATIKALENSKARPRILVNALRRDGDSPETPVILELPVTVFEKFCSIAQSYIEEGVNVFDFESGHDIVIERTGTGLSTKYEVLVTPKATKIDPSVMDRLHNIDEYVAQEYDAGLKKALAAVGTVRGAIGSTSPAARLTSAGAVTSEETSLDDDLDAIDGDFVEQSETAAEESESPEPTSEDSEVQEAAEDTDDVEALMAELESLS